MLTRELEAEVQIMAEKTLQSTPSNNVEDGFGEIDWNDLDHIENFMAKQFYSLSYSDRNAINEEVHGVRSMACEETPALIEGSLRLLEIELQKLPPDYQMIYDKASSMRTYTSKDFAEDLAAESNDLFDDNIFSPQENPSSSTPSSSCYVRSRSFQLAFLRCEFFHSKKAAIRLAKYLRLAFELYGEEALRRPLRINDIASKEELEVLNAGHQQLLPFRDRSGRRVLAIHGDLNLPSTALLARSVLSKGPAMKLLLYMWTVLLEDEDAQQRGLVVVFWPRYVDHSVSDRYNVSEIEATEASTSTSSRKKQNRRRAKRKSRKSNFSDNIDRDDTPASLPDVDSRSMGKLFFEAIPVRMCSIHVCLPSTPFFRVIHQIMLWILGDTYRTRVKTHKCVGMEVLYSLTGYGIPVDTLPMDEVTQTIKTKNQASFIRIREKIEAGQFDIYNASNATNNLHSDCSSDGVSTSSDGSNRSSIIECPSLNDVIFRSGKSYMCHPGNMMFRELIEQHIEEHNGASQDRKKNLTWQVIDEVESKGGRFLEFDRSLGTWTELTDRSVVRHKIATYFKEFRRKMKAQQQMQIIQSSTHEFQHQDGRKRKKRKSITRTCPTDNCYIPWDRKEL